MLYNNRKGYLIIMDVEYVLLIIAGIATAIFIIKVLIFAFTNDSRSLISSYQLVSLDSIASHKNICVTVYNPYHWK